MGSYQSSTSAAPLYAASSETGRVKLGRGTSSTRADKAAIRPRIQALRYAFAAETIGSVPSVPVFLLSPYFSPYFSSPYFSSLCDGVPRIYP